MQFYARSDSGTLTARLPEAQWQDYADVARRFALDWAHETDEKGEAHSFWDEFLLIFNIRRRNFAKHEARAKRSDNRRGFMDLFWPGKLLVEHKAGHKNKADDFEEALRQALDYTGEMPKEQRPQKLIICNFKQFRLYDAPNVPPNASSASDPSSWSLTVQFPIEALPQHFRQFAFLLDFAGQMLEGEEKGTIEAAQLEEFKSVRKNVKKLAAFRGKLHKLRFLDPACGCGNFLVVTYRELRRLDFNVGREIRLRTGQLVENTDMLKNVWLTQFHGLETKPVSALIVSMLINLPN